MDAVYIDAYVQNPISIRARSVLVVFPTAPGFVTRFSTTSCSPSAFSLLLLPEVLPVLREGGVRDGRTHHTAVPQVEEREEGDVGNDDSGRE